MRKLLVIFVILLFLSALFGGYLLNIFYLSSPAGSAPTVKFIIERGDGVGKISYKLKEANIIDSRLWFEAFVWFKGVSQRFQYGIFDLKSGMNYREIVELTTLPQTVDTEVLLQEGLNLKNYASILEERGLLRAEDFWDVVGQPAIDYSKKKSAPRPLGNFSKEFSFLSDKPYFVSLEGYLFPDTYRFNKDSSAKKIAQKMLANFDAKLSQELRDEIKKQGKTIFSVITMASIIEREARGYENMQKVSDIFWRRLRAYMPLQADSTVNYVTGKSDPSASYADIAIDSPWNTYKHQGLPLGPICNPGLDAIKAAIYPKANPYWYFLTTPEGEVIYSKTLDEHNKNKAKYLK